MSAYAWTGPRKERLRWELWAGNGGRCGICGDPIEYTAHGHERLTIDHIKPVSLGGTNARDNLQPAHFRCNQAKGDGLPKPRNQAKGDGLPQKPRRKRAVVAFPLPVEALDVLQELREVLCA